MDEKITLAFTEEHKYQLTFSPPSFWKDFARDYRGLPWIEIGDDQVAIVAENYSYLLDLLVQARLFRLNTLRDSDRFQ
ncbi:MAG: hypothetical protein NTW84_03685 [Methanothrix sp.]|jgi:hypothetical protein|nr:hypothetical protein [Methanothrix sp.]